jgi:hypothetical protein
MAHWTPSYRNGSSVWRRSLGSGEASFYWDGVLDGTFDAMQYELIEVANSHLDVLYPENINRAWLAVKRRFPLLATRTVREDDDRVYFEVSENSIYSIADGELDIGRLSSLDEISAYNETFLSGPRQLSSEQNVKVVIRFEPEHQGSHHSNRGWTRFHIWLLASHSISDGAANMSLFTNFMIMLTTPSQRITEASIGERLAMVPDGETLHHSPSHSVARRRWRKAIASALLIVREAHIKVGKLLSFPKKDSCNKLATGWSHASK